MGTKGLWLLLVVISFTGSHGSHKHLTKVPFNNAEKSLSTLPSLLLPNYEDPGLQSALLPLEQIPLPGFTNPNNPSPLPFSMQTTPFTPLQLAGVNEGALRDEVPSAVSYRPSSIITIKQPGQSVGSSVKEMFETASKFIAKTLGDLNSLIDKYVPKKVRDGLSLAQIKMMTVGVRMVLNAVELLVKLVTWLQGDLCINTPDIPNVLNIFTFQGGRVCPFSAFKTKTIKWGSTPDGRQWVISIPLQLFDVEIDFARVTLWTPLGPVHVAGGMRLLAKQVTMGTTLVFSKSVIPIINPVKTIEHSHMEVNNCIAFNPHAGVVENAILKYGSKLCDPLLNSVIHLATESAKINLNAVSWLFRKLFSSGGWIYSLLVSLMKKLS